MNYFFLKIMDNGQCTHPALQFSGSVTLRLNEESSKDGLIDDKI